MKVHSNITIDQDVWEKAQKSFPNAVSTLVNDYLKNLVLTDISMSNGIKIEVERLKLKRELEQMAKIKASVDERQRKIESYEQEIEKKRIEELEKEQKQIEATKNCFVCGNIAKKSYEDRPVCSVRCVDDYRERKKIEVNK